jgi:hypothetical protein
VPHFSWAGEDRRPYCSLHDEIIVEAGDAIADQEQAIVKESMDEAFKAGKFLRAIFAAYWEPGSAM